MRVLGISPLDKDATASFLEDGRVVFACGEERLSRLKLQDGFPKRAVELGLERTGWDPATIDAVAYAFFDGPSEARLLEEALDRDAQSHRSDCTAASLRNLKTVSSNGYHVDRTIPIPGLSSEEAEFLRPKSWFKRFAYNSMARSSRLDWRAHRHNFKQIVQSGGAEHCRWARELVDGLKPYGLDKKIRRFHHHDTHAANAFFASGYEEALLVTLDGYGSGAAGGVYVGQKGSDSAGAGIKLLHRFSYPNSLGHFYEQVTSGLGFKPSRHEGKIVGLAAYGDPRHLKDVLLERFECDQGDIRIRAALNPLLARVLAGRFAKRDVAAAYQHVLEEVTKKTVRYWLDKTGLKNVAVSGGVHANVKLNQRIRELDGVESVFVYPNMGDGGCGTGAAMLCFERTVFQGVTFDNVYFGPDFTEAQIEQALRQQGLACEHADNIEDHVARLLTEDYIVGRFNGRMEYGPRALGNRSILYPARDPEVNQWLNHQLGRTEFMPFAPAALAEESHRLFIDLAGCEKTAEFMTITFDCTDEMKRQCPAAVHVDGTARPQLVNERSNPSFHRILKGYFERTGIPAIINTSFNMHEEPIICSPTDAVRAFLDGNIDYLAIGSFLVPHPRLKENTKDRRGSRKELVFA